MPAYNETDRCKVFGVYTGCPCSIKLNKGISIADRNHNRKNFEKEVSDLIKQWHSSCDKFQPGPSIGYRYQENWNRAVKLPYGRSACITCIYDETGTGGGNYCKFSLKGTHTKNLKKVYSLLPGVVRITGDQLWVKAYPEGDDFGVECYIPDNAILNVHEGDIVEQNELLFILED